MNVAFYTFGCKLNQCETEAMASYYRRQGFSICDIRDPAELYIINTCTVTSKSEQKARRVIRKLAAENPGSLVVVTGCYAQLDREALASLAPNLTVIPQDRKSSLFTLARELGSCPGFFGFSLEEKQEWLADRSRTRTAAPGPFAFKVDQFQFHSRAFCIIQDGCDNRCSYCRIPLARGGGVSLEADEVCRRVLKLEQAGYREVVLTGVNICAYKSGKTEFTGLLRQLLASISSLRIRLSSLEPEQVTGQLAALLADPRICPHFHLPVQSGSDSVLTKMKRRYRSEGVRRAVELLMQNRPGAFLAADVIVGFPGETEADFRQTRDLLAENNFVGLHIFPFSPRPGTPACHYKPPVPEFIRKQRALALKQLGETLQERYLARMQGREVNIILEKEERVGEELFWQGLSENYLKIRVPAPDYPFRKGSLLPVRITLPGSVCRGEVLLIF